MVWTVLECSLAVGVWLRGCHRHHRPLRITDLARTCRFGFVCSARHVVLLRDCAQSVAPPAHADGIIFHRRHWTVGVGLLAESVRMVARLYIFWTDVLVITA